jgi:hypothetical protein
LPHSQGPLPQGSRKSGFIQSTIRVNSGSGHLRASVDFVWLSTLPGQIAMNNIPSLLYNALCFAITMLTPALLIAYGAATSTSTSLTKSKSPIPLVIAIIFLAEPLRMRGTKALTVLMRPTTLILKDSFRSSSRMSGFSLLKYAI